jgi:hypothetical protein
MLGPGGVQRRCGDEEHHAKNNCECVRKIDIRQEEAMPQELVDKVPTRFFEDERKLATGGIRLTQAMLKLASDQSAATDLSGEAESRWRLVEEAWDARAANRQVTVLYDAPRELLVPALLGKRRPITEVRPALNGYQKGHCFFCFRPIAVVPGPHGDGADVDHFFPMC